MTYRKVKGKYVICHHGAYFVLLPEELLEMKVLIADIESGEGKFYDKDARRT